MRPSPFLDEIKNDCGSKGVTSIVIILRYPRFICSVLSFLNGEHGSPVLQLCWW